MVAGLPMRYTFHKFLSRTLRKYRVLNKLTVCNDYATVCRKLKETWDIL